ncbi:MAG: hypothetical protein KJI71_01400 [Patescibacteria group bacterium]|nr:hypothetical protein [Patescibacteria group bacterium]
MNNSTKKYKKKSLIKVREIDFDKLEKIERNISTLKKLKNRLQKKD